MKRWIVASVVPLLLAILWVRSYWRGYVLVGVPVTPSAEEAKPMPLSGRTWQYQYRIAVDRGLIQHVRRHSEKNTANPAGLRSLPPGQAADLRIESFAPSDLTWHWGGFHYYKNDRGVWPGTTGTRWGQLIITAPIWAVLWVASLPLCIMSIRYRRRRLRAARMAGRICIKCGYDLRASLGVCPECGTARE